MPAVVRIGGLRAARKRKPGSHGKFRRFSPTYPVCWLMPLYSFQVVASPGLTREPNEIVTDFTNTRRNREKLTVQLIVGLHEMA
jgi:hypothetical protein